MTKDEKIARIAQLDPEFKLSGEERVHELDVIIAGLEAPGLIEDYEETIDELNKELATAEVKAESKGNHKLVGEIEGEKVFMTIPRAKYTDKDGVKHLITPQVLQGNEALLSELYAKEPGFLITK